MMILDRYGEPIPVQERVMPGGGWIENGNLGTPLSNTLAILPNAPQRNIERSWARYAFLTNPVVSGAIEVIHGYVIGEGISYGEMSDTRAYDQLEEFYAINNLEEKISRWFYEYLIDGENLTLFPVKNSRNRASSQSAARVGFYPVENEIKFNMVDGLPDVIDTIETNGSNNAKVTRTTDEFVWTAHKALWNDPRGWPVIMQAVPAALAYIDFINDRLKINKIATRLNGIYKTFIYSKAPDAAFAEKKKNASEFGKMPGNNKIVTIGKDPITGEAEEFELFAPKTSASEASQDARLLYLLVCVALNMPEHFLGFTGEVTRTTAENQNTPISNALKRHQSAVRSWLDKTMRLELKRRNGVSKRYRVRTTKVLPGGDIAKTGNNVLADNLYFPWNFPKIDSETTGEMIAKINLLLSRKLISDTTISGKLGVDYALEKELMANQPEDEPENDEMEDT